MPPEKLFPLRPKLPLKFNTYTRRPGQTRFVVCALHPVSNEIKDLRAGGVELEWLYRSLPAEWLA